MGVVGSLYGRCRVLLSRLYVFPGEGTKKYGASFFVVGYY